jgi:hypothetical protein
LVSQELKLNFSKIDGRFSRLVGIGNQSGHQIDHAIGHPAVAGMLNLRNILELVMDSFDTGALSKEKLIGKR